MTKEQYKKYQEIEAEIKDTKQREGEWIWDKEHSNYKCGLCGEYDITTPKFCRECGAKMKGV